MKTEEAFTDHLTLVESLFSVNVNPEKFKFILRNKHCWGACSAIPVGCY